MGINIVTYSGKTRTAKHDAIVYDVALYRSGILNGCNVTANNNVITVSSGYGIIKGRLFEISSESFTLSLPGSGTTYGALIVTLDLGADEPLKLETISSSTSTFNLTRNENANFNNGRYQIIIATYTLTRTAVSNITKGHVIATDDSLGSTNFNDYTEPGNYYFSSISGFLNIPSGVVNGWLIVFSSPSGNVTKQVFLRQGSSDNHHQIYTRTKTAGVWLTWRRVISSVDLTNGLDLIPVFGTSTTDANRYVRVKNSYRDIGLDVTTGGNAGIRDLANSEWIIVSDENGDVRIPHKLSVTDFAPTNVNAGNADGTGSYHVSVMNKYRYFGMNVSNAENAGLFDFDADGWIMFNNKEGVTAFPMGPMRFDNEIRAPKSIVRGTVSMTHTAANTSTYKDVNWSEMAGTPVVFVTPIASAPETVSVAVTNVTKTGCRIHMTRSNNPGNSTTIHYLAVYTW